MKTMKLVSLFSIKFELYNNEIKKKNLVEMKRKKIKSRNKT